METFRFLSVGHLNILVHYDPTKNKETIHQGFFDASQRIWNYPKALQ
jgi:hypothetical protein